MGYELRCLLGRFAACGKKYHKAGALLTASGGFNANRSMMAVDNPRDNRETEAHAGFLGGHKRIEDLLPQFPWNSRP